MSAQDAKMNINVYGFEDALSKVQELTDRVERLTDLINAQTCAIKAATKAVGEATAILPNLSPKGDEPA